MNKNLFLMYFNASSASLRNLKKKFRFYLPCGEYDYLRLAKEIENRKELKCEIQEYLADKEIEDVSFLFSSEKSAESFICSLYNVDTEIMVQDKTMKTLIKIKKYKDKDTR